MSATRVRLLFVDEGSYHEEIVELPQEWLDRYERVIDCLREEQALLEKMYLDVDRLCAAFVIEGD